MGAHDARNACSRSRNRRSGSPGLTAHDGPEYAVAEVRQREAGSAARGLTLKHQRRRFHRSATLGVDCTAVNGPDQRWALDFVPGSLAGGASIRVLAAIDLFTRERVALLAATSFAGRQVAEAVDRAGSKSGALPERIRGWTTARSSRRGRSITGPTETAGSSTSADPATGSTPFAGRGEESLHDPLAVRVRHLRPARQAQATVE
jgi:transposase InsO family protein